MKTIMCKYFIITVDTEGDDLWSYKLGDFISTKNADFIQPFQALCEKYGFKPVYLTNYEMANNNSFVKQATKWLVDGSCEIGIHLHAWNNPPLVDLIGPYGGNPYLIEYSEDIMRDKFETIFNHLKEKFSVIPVSHRAGRWAMDTRYFKILREYGVLVDCSHTAGASWKSQKGVTMGGSDYTNVPDTPTLINGVLEVPISVMKSRLPIAGTFRHLAKCIIKGHGIYLRPASSLLREMRYYLNVMSRRKDLDYVEFMIHSSELMPGGSPYFPDSKSVEQLYKTMDYIFSYAHDLGYRGITLKDYYKTRVKCESVL